MVALMMQVHVPRYLNLASVEVLVLGQNPTVQRNVVCVEVDCPSDDVAGLAAPVEESAILRTVVVLQAPQSCPMGLLDLNVSVGLARL